MIENIENAIQAFKTHKFKSFVHDKEQLKKLEFLFVDTNHLVLREYTEIKKGLDDLEKEIIEFHKNVSEDENLVYLNFHHKYDILFNRIYNFLNNYRNDS